jgi:hypothetical protein
MALSSPVGNKTATENGTLLSIWEQGCHREWHFTLHLGTRQLQRMALYSQFGNKAAIENGTLHSIWEQDSHREWHFIIQNFTLVTDIQVNFFFSGCPDDH